MKKVKYALLTLGIICGLGFIALSPTAGAVDLYQCDNPANASLPICKDKNKNITTTVTGVINIILYILGALAVIMIIYSGILYVLSGGDANNVTKAKNTLMYAIIGLVVALVAYAIVNFVVKAFS